MKKVRVEINIYDIIECVIKNRYNEVIQFGVYLKDKSGLASYCDIRQVQSGE